MPNEIVITLPSDVVYQSFIRGEPPPRRYYMEVWRKRRRRGHGFGPTPDIALKCARAQQEQARQDAAKCQDGCSTSSA